MVPLLIRGLRERVTAIKRKSALIIDNMSKVSLVIPALWSNCSLLSEVPTAPHSEMVVLHGHVSYTSIGQQHLRHLAVPLQLVDNPADAAVFLPRLLPGLERVSQEVSDPECRSVATSALATLRRVGAEGEAQGQALQVLVQDQVAVSAVVARVLGAVAAGAELADGAKAVQEYVASLCHQLVSVRDFEAAHWEEVCTLHHPGHVASCTCSMLWFQAGWGGRSAALNVHLYGECICASTAVCFCCFVLAVVLHSNIQSDTHEHQPV